MVHTLPVVGGVTIGSYAAKNQIKKALGAACVSAAVLAVPLVNKQLSGQELFMTASKTLGIGAAVYMLFNVISDQQEISKKRRDRRRHKHPCHLGSSYTVALLKKKQKIRDVLPSVDAAGFSSHAQNFTSLLNNLPAQSNRRDIHYILQGPDFMTQQGKEQAQAFLCDNVQEKDITMEIEDIDWKDNVTEDQKKDTRHVIKGWNYPDLPRFKSLAQLSVWVPISNDQSSVSSDDRQSSKLVAELSKHFKQYLNEAKVEQFISTFKGKFVFAVSEDADEANADEESVQKLYTSYSSDSTENFWENFKKAFLDNEAGEFRETFKDTLACSQAGVDREAFEALTEACKSRKVFKETYGALLVPRAAVVQLARTVVGEMKRKYYYQTLTFHVLQSCI